MQDNLLTIEEIISRARKSGATLGHGNPKIHLAYLTKLRLLPQTVRRKIGKKIVGCYPEQIVATLKKIEELKTAGLSYGQIRYQLSGGSPIIPNFAPTYVPNDRFTSLAFLLIGLILGFLVAANYSGSSIKSAQAAMAALPENTNPTLVKVESGNSSSEPIYLIAIPNQNLYKLGKTDINQLK